MSELKDLVPPLSLCRMIPAGKFGDSALVWELQDDETWWEVILRSEARGEPAYPAPTLEEIMAALPASVCYYLGNRWISCFVNDTISSGEKGERGVTAALKLWFLINGVEVKE